MRPLFFNLTMLITILVLITYIPVKGQDYKITFQVDMTKAEVTDPSGVGIRGSIAPLSWTETYLMKGPDKNGIYSVTIPFEGQDYGTRLQYKYYHGDNIWDNDHYGENGNRIATFCCKKQRLPIDTWDKLDAIAFENLLKSSAWNSFMTMVFIIGDAKEQGRTIEEIAQANIDFWDWPVWEDEPLKNFMIMDEINQASSPHGYFEKIEYTPEKLEYIINKDWEIMFFMWSEEGEINGVTAEEMTFFIKYMYDYYVTREGFNVSFKDEKDRKMRITMTK